MPTPKIRLFLKTDIPELYSLKYKLFSANLFLLSSVLICPSNCPTYLVLRYSEEYIVEHRKIINNKRQNILLFQFKKSVNKKNKIIPKKALIVFDLSPVISIPIKPSSSKDDIIILNFSFFKTIN